MKTLTCCCGGVPESGETDMLCVVGVPESEDTDVLLCCCWCTRE